MKRLLFHACCGPCLIAPYTLLKEEDEFEVTCYWYNDNIHPFKEYEARLNSLLEWSDKVSAATIIDDEYNPRQFMRRVNNREDERCYFCYYQRMFKAAEAAKRNDIGLFTTTLLYSVYQKHDLIKLIGNEIAEKLGIEFYYRDFRTLWRKGIEMSKEAGMYRQKYCGCLYSEEDRWKKKK